MARREWYDITQERINAFAEATNDHQWIHVDPERAASSPLGSTIAHGLFSLSLGPQFSYQLIHFDGFAHSLNYGYDKVRFQLPFPWDPGSACAQPSCPRSSCPAESEWKMSQVVEREGSDKPVVVAESVARVVEKS